MLPPTVPLTLGTKFTKSTTSKLVGSKRNYSSAIITHEESKLAPSSAQMFGDLAKQSNEYEVTEFTIPEMIKPNTPKRQKQEGEVITVDVADVPIVEEVPLQIDTEDVQMSEQSER